MSQVELSFSMKQDGPVRRPSISLRTTKNDSRQKAANNLGRTLSKGGSGQNLTKDGRMEFRAGYSEREAGVSMIIKTSAQVPQVNWTADDALKTIMANASKLKNKLNQKSDQPIDSNSSSARRSSEPNSNHYRQRSSAREYETPRKIRRSSESRAANFDRELERVRRDLHADQDHDDSTSSNGRGRKSRDLERGRARENIRTTRPPRALDTRDKRR